MRSGGAGGGKPRMAAAEWACGLGPATGALPYDVSAFGRGDAKTWDGPAVDLAEVNRVLPPEVLSHIPAEPPFEAPSGTGGAATGLEEAGSTEAVFVGGPAKGTGSGSRRWAFPDPPRAGDSSASGRLSSP